jgi:LysR family transcriptional regulator (chromosome initiation inhibitor)
MLDYKLIEALAMVVQECGFEKAARRLHLTQSAVSQRIRLLEEQTGQVLLARTSPPRATRAGKQMIRHYLQVRQLEEDLVDTWTPSGEKRFVTFSIGINGDSLATWFLDAVSGFVKQERILLDLRHDDQEQTHRLLRDGEVVGCISVKDKPMQGCRMAYLGRMDYRMLATPAFVKQWFPRGMTLESIAGAPLVIFNRRDELHTQFFRLALAEPPSEFWPHYLPSAEKFIDIIAQGLAYGMLPDQQSRDALAAGRLVEVLPGCCVPVRLYWHCWNLKSDLLQRFSNHLVDSAHRLLPG